MIFVKWHQIGWVKIRYWLDSTAILNDLGWKAEIDWGLKEMVGGALNIKTFS